MAGLSEQSIDPKRTIVVLNFPSNVGEDELTIHFQKESNGGGDVDDVVVDASVALVTFDMPEVATSVLNHPEQVINDRKIDVHSYESWLANKKKQVSTMADQEDSQPEDGEDEVRTIYVSGIKDSTTEEAITFFFETKKRTGGGDLCEGSEGLERVAPTAVRLTFVSSKDAQDVLKKANETPLKLEGNLLNVSTEFVPTHDRSILLAKNINPETNEETFKSFVEVKKKADVLNVVMGKDGTAIVILKSEIDDRSNEENSKEDMKLDGSVISLEFAPLTKGIRISNIPQGTSSDDMRFKFSNPKSGGGQVTNTMLDTKNGVANVYFENCSVVSELVKREHKFKDVPLTVIPYYDEFQELQAMTTKTAFSGDYHIDPLVMYHIMNHQGIEKKFDLEAMKFDESTSRFHFTKEFEDPKDAAEFTNKLKEFLHSFVREEVKIPKGAVFERVKEAIEGKRDEFDADVVEFNFDGSRVIFVGKREDVVGKKQLVEAMIDTFTEEAQKESTHFSIYDINKLKFLNFIDYFKELETDFPEVQIHGMENSSGKLSLVGTTGKTKDVKIKIFEDLMKISEIDVKMSDHQIDFLQRTDCQIVNDELKKDDVMLMLVSIEGAVEAKALHTKIFSLEKCGDTKKKRLVNTVLAKASEKCKQVDEETASFLTKSDKLQEFMKEQFDKNQVLIGQKLTDPCNIWIVCEDSKMNNAEQELTSLTDELKIASSKFKLTDPVRVRFLKEHCWNKIKEKEHSCRSEGVVVIDAGSNTLEVKGTQAGMKEMITFLEDLAGKVNSKAYPLSEPGMKKQMSMEATKMIISEIEKNNSCVIVKNIEPEKIPEKSKDPVEGATVVAGGGTVSGTSTMKLPYNNSMSFVNDKEVKMTSGHRITIVVGNLAHQQVDVIVNTTNNSVDLTGNACGRALLKVAGNELLEECKKIGSLQAGQVAVTGPAKLKCKHVYHVRSSHWNNGKGAPVLRHLIKTCLGQAEKDKLASIAIPAIGTGNLHFPRPEVAKIFFQEITSYFITHPQSTIDDIRFVAYSRDQATVDAFLGEVQEIKSVVLSPPSKSVPVSTQSNSNNVSTNEKPDGSLELSLGSGNLTVQIVCDDISKEKTDLVMHVIGQDFTPAGGVAKALIKAGGDTIIQECKALGKPALYSTQYTKAGRLAVRQIAHVISPASIKIPDLKKCLDTFFDDVSRKNIASISFSAIGAGAMGFSEGQSADLIFDNLCRIVKGKNPTLRLVRIVIFDKAKFIKFKDATKVYFASRGATSLSPRLENPSPAPRKSFKFVSLSGSKIPKKLIKKDWVISITIYSDDRGKIDNAWEELKRHMNQNIQEKIMTDDVIKEFTDRDLEKLRKLERDFDFEIKIDQQKGEVKFKGHVLDIANVQGKIGEIVNDIKDNKNKVPDYWVDSPPSGEKFHKFNLSTNSKEYQDIEAQFHRTAPNQIVRIERIQNREIYEVYNVKRQAMMKKHGSNFPGKELMLFHGTSAENIEKINAGGLNRSYAGQHATAFGRGVYFARDASYSCQQTYSPPDSHGLRYMYYAKVLVGEYTQGNSTMIVAPNKNYGNPNETFHSVVNNIATPTIYVMFQDYEYYTEYLITFR